MSILISKLAVKLDCSVEEIVKILNDLDFAYDEEKMSLDDDLAELIEDEIGTTKSNVEVLVEKLQTNLDREVIKSQRKKTAGKDFKDSGKKKDLPSTKVDRLEIDESISVKELAEKSGINAAKIIGELMKNGIIANINQLLDYDTAALIMSEFAVELKRNTTVGSATDFIEQNLSAIVGDEDVADLQERAPIITIMGHVDHGKTKLLDTIRHSNVVDTESGGITQHIGAYQIVHNDKKITFLDTPGHEAFTHMRSRGAKLTDIAILVVSATEGVKPTTIEAINHAKDAGVPIIVAINKIDLPDSNIDKIKGELAEYGLQSEDWGGDTVMVPVSALNNVNIDKLLDMILLVAEMQNLKANRSRSAVATVIETHLDSGMGPVATVVINTGTLNIGDAVLVGDAYGKIKTMLSDTKKKLNSAEPSLPVFISGLSKTPQAGDILQVMNNEKTARDHAMQINAFRNNLRINSGSLMQDIVHKIKTGEMKVLKLIVKTDTKGSFDAIKQSLDGIIHDEVMIKVIHSGVGNVKESDVAMASASHAVIVGFHVSIPPQVESSIERTGVVVKLYKIIYELLADIKNILTGLLSPEIVTVDLGKAEVRQVFLKKRDESILGLKITNGLFRKSAKVRVIRNDEIIGEGSILTLQRIDKQVDEIKAKNECGIKFKGGVDVEEGDVLECYVLEERAKSI